MHGMRELPLSDGSRTAYFDSGGRGRPVVCLHGHFGRGHLWGPVAAALAPAHRVIAPDLPGHGRWPRSTGDWLGDAVLRVGDLSTKLGLREPALLGHSSGGTVAYTLAARQPEQFAALISVEAPAVISAVADPEVWNGVPSRFASFADLRAAVASPWHWESAAEFDDGWGFRFDAASLMEA